MKKLVLQAQEQAKLELMARRPKTDQRTAQRARIVLDCAAGLSNTAVATKRGVTLTTVGKWRQRFLEGRLGALGDAPRSGQPRKLTDAKVEAVIHPHTGDPAPERHALEHPHHGPSQRPQAKRHRPHLAGLWPQAAFAGELQTLHRCVLRGAGARHRRPVSEPAGADPRGVVLCVDEKSQVQALDRSQPILPMRPGQAERRTHDYYRHGTTSLFAALDIATGKVIGRCQKQHRHQEFLRFRDQIERTVPAPLEVHLVLDNYATHKTPKVAKWFRKHPRYHRHFTPASGSWLNQVERWFGRITEQRIRRGAFKSVDELIAAIDDYIAANNQHPKPFVWTATAELILDRVATLCQRTNRSPH